VPYKAVVETLPVQLAAGEGPDIARVTDLGGLNKYYLDLTPHLSAARQKVRGSDNFASTLPWFRAGAADKGIYGLMSQLTVTGAYVNKTLFDQAKVPMPGPTRPPGTTGWPPPTRWPRPPRCRSRWRWTAPATDSPRWPWPTAPRSSTPTACPWWTPATRLAVKKFVDWHKAGLMPKEVWGGVGGSQYRDAFEEFANGRVVDLLLRLVAVRRMDTQVTKAFEWAVCPGALRPGRLHRHARRRGLRRPQAHQAAGPGGQVPRLPGARTPTTAS
jgi:alpha-1,4-digalacturonate transport system substrate-binding protein